MGAARAGATGAGVTVATLAETVAVGAAAGVTTLYGEAAATRVVVVGVGVVVVRATAVDGTLATVTGVCGRVAATTGARAGVGWIGVVLASATGGVSARAWGTAWTRASAAVAA